MDGRQPQSPCLIARKLEGILEANKAVEAAYLFGSAARGEMTTSSDIDVGVLPSTDLDALARFNLRMTLIDELSVAMDRQIDVVVVEDMPAHLIHQMLKDKILLKGRDSSRRLLFEMAHRRLFFDMQIRRKQYGDALLNRAFGGTDHGARGHASGTLEAARRIRHRFRGRSGD